MKADYLSFQRASRASLLGLFIQLALGLLMLLFGLFRGDVAAVTASVYVLLGVPVWLTLALLFDQHRRERIEAIEAETFAASDAATSSVFEERSDELRVAARRLRMMYRIVVPVVSLLVGAALIAFGVWRFLYYRGYAENAALPFEGQARGWPIAITIAIAAVGFLFARYVSGLAKIKSWAIIRAGAGFAVGTALMGLAIAVGHFVDLAGPDSVLRHLPMVYSAVLVALGAEVLLNFMLEVYRPRKAGEHPRPAFESRVLGFVAAPDRIAESIGEAINYQFGYDVSSSWFYQLLSRVVLKVLLPVAAVTLWAMSCLAVIRPHEQGLVTRFGSYSRTIDPGLNFKWPWPIERVEVPGYVVRDAQGKVVRSGRTVKGVRTLALGSLTPDPTKPALWNMEHAGNETYFVVQPIGAAGSAAASREISLLAVEVPLQYYVDDVVAYDRLGPPEMRDELIRAAAQRAVMQYLSTLSVMEVLSGRREELSGALRSRVEAAFAELGDKDESGRPRGAGVKIVFVGVDGMHPPKDTVMSFENVVDARLKYAAKLDVARGERIKTLTGAVGSVELATEIVAELERLDAMRVARRERGGEDAAIVEQELKIRGLIQRAGGRASAMILEASADRWARHMGERARLSAYKGQLGAYRAAPEYYKASLYLDALRSAMVNARVYIAEGAERLHLRYNFEDRDTSAQDIIRSQQPVNY